jgi:carboxyl-terminal processing protease
MRKLLLIFFCAAVCLQAASALLSAGDRKLEIDSFEQVWRTINDSFWDPSFGGLNWRAVHDELLPKIEQARTHEEARAVLEEMIGRLHLTHFEIIGSDVSSELDDLTARRGLGETGIDVRVIRGKAIVTSVEDGTPAARASVRPGWEVVRAGDTPAARIIAEAGHAYEHSTLRELILREALTGQMSGPIGSQIEIEFRDGEDRPVVKTLDEARPNGVLSRFGYLPPTYVWIRHQMAAPQVGLVRFNMFLDPVDVMRTFGDAVSACLACRGFIIDLRGNPGGIGAMAMGMAGWFVDKPHERLGTLYMRSGKLNFTINPRAEVFNGPLAILVDETSASTSEILAGGLKDLGRARIFGSRTAAAALPSAIIMLPNGDGFQYAMADYISEGGKRLEGNGVKPDVEAPWTREALLAGRDPALDAALHWIDTVRPAHKPLTGARARRKQYAQGAGSGLLCANYQGDHP